MKLLVTCLIALSAAPAAARPDQGPPASLRPTASAMGTLQCEQDRARAIASGWDMSDVHLPCEAGVKPPTRKNEMKPKYTAAAMRAKVQGSIEISAIVEVDGVVRDAKVAKSLDATYGLDEEALNAVRATKFTPGTLRGNVARVLVTFELYFACCGRPR